jgi:hypothetical protein
VCLTLLGEPPTAAADLEDALCAQSPARQHGRKNIAMKDRDLAIVASAPPDCGDCRDQVILANLAWLNAHGYRLSTSREYVVDPDGEGSFTVGLLAERDSHRRLGRPRCRPGVE